MSVFVSLYVNVWLVPSIVDRKTQFNSLLCSKLYVYLCVCVYVCMYVYMYVL